MRGALRVAIHANHAFAKRLQSKDGRDLRRSYIKTRSYVLTLKFRADNADAQTLYGQFLGVQVDADGVEVVVFRQ